VSTAACAGSGREDRLKRLLTIGHSYVVAQNRRLAHELAVQGRGEWQVTAAAPARLHGDLRFIELEPIPNEACSVVPVDVRFGSHPHLRMFGGRLGSLLEQPWDVVHAWEEPYVIASAQIARRVQPGVTFVPATFQNISKHYPPPTDFIEKRVMRRADAWIAFGQTVYDTLSNRPGYSGKPSRVLSPGVDTVVFTPDPAARASMRNTFGWKSDAPVVGFAGRFIPGKGVDTVLHAFAHSKHRWNVLFIGDGALAPRIESLRLQHPSRVRLVRDAGHDDMPAYLRALDLLCVPSRTTERWREQFGRMLIEAMACGVPVVASDSGEIPNVVQDAGVVIPANDLTAWTDTIDNLVANSSMRAQLAARGLARVRAEFSWPVVARRHLDFFDEVSRR
jgi:glycosyltransferase involved in cell wall biosynthesis